MITLLAFDPTPLFGFLLAVVAIFIILLVLVQRGRGGGLAGALGGVGGSSAFGAKAGDVFTRITIGAAAVWIALCIAAAKLGGGGSNVDMDSAGPNTQQSAGMSGAAGDDEGEDAAVGAAAAKENAAKEDAASNDATTKQQDSAAE